MLAVPGRGLRHAGAQAGRRGARGREGGAAKLPGAGGDGAVDDAGAAWAPGRVVMQTPLWTPVAGGDSGRRT
jgi:hypothetical protein